MHHLDRLAQRTGPMKAMGIIHLVVGTLSAFVGAVACVVSVFLIPRVIETTQEGAATLPSEDGLREAAARLAASQQWSLLFSLVALVSGVLFLVGGRGLLAMRPWGRSLTLGLCWFALAADVIEYVVQLAALTKGQSLVVGSMLPYWVLAIVLLMSRQWREAYAPEVAVPTGIKWPGATAAAGA